MKESPPNAAVEESRGFRFSPQLVAIVLVTLLALAIPLTILSIGIVRMGRRPVAPTVSLPAPEVPGLRAILERVADDKLAPGQLSDGRGRIVVVESKENWNLAMLEIEKASRELGGTVAADTNGGGRRLLIQVPAEVANRFQASLAPSARVETEPARNASVQIYQVHFQETP